MDIHDAVQRLCSIVEQLRKSYPPKNFPLDGKLVGDLGTTLVMQDYDIEPYNGTEKHYSGEMQDGKSVQIRSTMKDTLQFPDQYIPDHYIGIKIHSNGTYSVIFNGPGYIAEKAINGRIRGKERLHSIPLARLEKLCESVPNESRIAKRKK